MRRGTAETPGFLLDPGSRHLYTWEQRMLPRQYIPLFDAALKHHSEGRPSQALSTYEKLLPLDPSNPRLNYVLGLALFQLGNFERAETVLLRARALNPRDGQCRQILGLVHKERGNLEKAETELRAAIDLLPRSSEAWFNLAAVMVQAGSMEKAFACFQKAAEVDPKNPLAWVRLGFAAKRLGRPEDALEFHGRALKIDAKNAEARLGRAEAFQALTRTAEALVELDQHLRNHPRDLNAISMRLMLMNYGSELGPRALFEAHLAYGKTVENLLGPLRPQAAPARLPGGPLRVGILSADLREHSVAFFLLPLLQYLDRSAFEVHVFYEHHFEDSVSAIFRPLVSGWHVSSGLDSLGFENLLRTARLDVLLDLAGHTMPLRLPLLAKRLAPVQISYLGYPNTTGLSAVDYRFVDAISDPEGVADSLHTERLVRFSNCAWCYFPPTDAPEPAVVEDRDRPFHFGSFNSFAKLSVASLGVWKEILDRVPNSKLVLKSVGGTEGALGARLAAQGIPKARVLFLPHCASTLDHLASYEKMDLGLDPFPYNGTTTTCEALWMGTPVIALKGDRHAARVGASLLTSAGLGDFVAETPQDYVALAVKWSAEREKLWDLRRNLRAQVRQSVLCDGRGQASRFWSAVGECYASAVQK